MTPSEEIMQFLTDNPTFYLATVDGYLPRVRPLGFAMWYKDHLCLGIGKHKAAYKQLLDNTNLEICACNEKGEFLRVQGTANFDNTPEARCGYRNPTLSSILATQMPCRSCRSGA